MITDRKPFWWGVCGIIAILMAGVLTNGFQLKADQTAVGINCDRATFYEGAAAGFVQIISPTSTLYICGFTFTSGVAVSGVGLAFSPATSSCTGATKITPAFSLAANATITDTSPFWRGLTVPSGNGLCLNVPIAAPAVQAIIFYNTF